MTVKTRLVRIECEGHAVEVRITDEHFNADTIESVLRNVATRLVKLVTGPQPATNGSGERHE